jgi:hypothetical protein
VEGAGSWNLFQVRQYSWNVKEDDYVWLTEADYVLIRFILHDSHNFLFNSNLS